MEYDTVGEIFQLGERLLLLLLHILDREVFAVDVYTWYVVPEVAPPRRQDACLHGLPGPELRQDDVKEAARQVAQPVPVAGDLHGGVHVSTQLRLVSLRVSLLQKPTTIGARTTKNYHFTNYLQNPPFSGDASQQVLIDKLTRSK